MELYQLQKLSEFAVTTGLPVKYSKFVLGAWIAYQAVANCMSRKFLFGI
jgi:hypothetical protein